MMTKIGMIGLGRLGMPAAVAMAWCGHDVWGYDINPNRMRKAAWPFREEGVGSYTFDEMLRESGIKFGCMKTVVRNSDIVFVCVQTPHGSEFEGVTPLPEIRKDFDYSHLRKAVTEITQHAEPGTIVSVISTCMPGTIDRLIVPLAGGCIVAHTPFFPGMGTVIRDLLHQEFAVVGCNDSGASGVLREFWWSMSRAPAVVTNIANAEAIKVFYNTFISLKIGFANTVMEACHKIPGADSQVILGALKMSHERLISEKYLNGGMGDGGACHPRDCIALSWFARRNGMSSDLFGSLMEMREQRAEWLIDEMFAHDLPKCVVGTAFKKDTNIETGSHAMLVANLIKWHGYEVELYDPMVGKGKMPETPHVFLIGANHTQFENLRFPAGSVVIDPWRIVKEQEGVEVVWLGSS